MVDIKKPGRCAKCGGNEIPENDDGDWEIVCIQCGRRRSVNSMPPPGYVNENCFRRGRVNLKNQILNLKTTNKK